MAHLEVGDRIRFLQERHFCTPVQVGDTATVIFVDVEDRYGWRSTSVRLDNPPGQAEEWYIDGTADGTAWERIDVFAFNVGDRVKIVGNAHHLSASGMGEYRRGSTGTISEIRPEYLSSLHKDIDRVGYRFKLDGPMESLGLYFPASSLERVDTMAETSTNTNTPPAPVVLWAVSEDPTGERLANYTCSGDPNVFDAPYEADEYAEDLAKKTGETQYVFELRATAVRKVEVTTNTELSDL